MMAKLDDSEQQRPLTHEPYRMNAVTYLFMVFGVAAVLFVLFLGGAMAATHYDTKYGQSTVENIWSWIAWGSLTTNVAWLMWHFRD